MIRVVSPTVARLEGFEGARLKHLQEHLTYHDKKVDHEVSRLKNSTWAMQALVDELGSPEAAAEHLKQLKASRFKSLLFQDDQGLWTYSGLAQRLAICLDAKMVVEYTRPEAKLCPWQNVPNYPPRPYQQEAADKLLAIGHGAVELACHRKGERVLMFDGTLKAVEDIVVGDRLMGPDSQPRTVQELKRGRDTMFEVETVNGQKMVVNGNHLLVVRRTNRSNATPSDGRRRRKDYLGKNPSTVLTVNDWLAKSKTFKHLHKMYSAPVSFPMRSVPIDPYFLGVLLGDGSIQSTPAVTTMDEEIVREVESQAALWGLTVKKRRKALYFNGRGDIVENKAASYYLAGGRKRRNPIANALSTLGLWRTKCGTKFVPQIYKANSEDVRLEVLAGLIDTDGSYCGGCFDFVSKSQQLCEDTIFLARSLGLRATPAASCEKSTQDGVAGTYWRTCISGEISRVPTRILRKRAAKRLQKRDPSSFGFSVKMVSRDEEFFGFVLDGDHLYLTDSFLVTHNTGLGKSFIIQLVTRSLGRKTVIMAPGVSIARQLFDEIEHHFGKKKVGLFGDGKKDFKKQIVVAIGRSLTNVKEGTPAWDELSSADVFIADESHLTPAETLAKVCFGLLKAAPWRFFFSGTQIRNDGLELVLEGITGPIVMKMTVRDGVDQGYLAKPVFTMFELESEEEYWSKDSNAMTRAHLFYNPKVIALAANLANKSVSVSGRPVLILVEEMEQFTRLLPLLKHECRFAHGGVTKENKDKVPAQYHDSDPNAFVAEFNAGKVKVLIGTSCVATGTDIKVAKTIVYLRGGASAIEVRQGIGRGTRLSPGKTDCNVIDFNITNIPALERHAGIRAEIYDDIYGPVRSVDLSRRHAT